MCTLPTIVELRRDQILGIYAQLEPALADALKDYFEECRAPFVRDFPGAARLACEGRITVLLPGPLRDVENHLSDYGATVSAPATDAEPENRRYAAPVDALLRLGEFDARDEETTFPMFAMADIPDLLRMATDDELHRAPGISEAVWSPLHAMRALGELRYEAATEPLLAQLRRIDEDGDDFVGNAVTGALAAIGASTLGPSAQYLANSGHGPWARAAAARTLRFIGLNRPELRADCVALLTRQLARGTDQDQELNGMLIADLLDLKATESVTEIERAFAEGRVDDNVAGDWEDVQIELGFKKRRERPRRPTELSEMSRNFRSALGLPAIDELAGPRELQETADLIDWTKTKPPPPSESVKPVPLRVAPKPGRNDPCSCGSGKKFKKCCGA